MNSAAKKHKADDFQSPNESPRVGDTVSRTELDELFDTLKADIKSDTAAALTGLESNISQKFENLVRNYDSGAQKRFSAIDHEIKHVNDRADKLEETQKSMQGTIDRLERALASAETRPSSSIISSEAFDRDPDLTLLRVNTDELCTKLAIIDAIKPWLGEAGFQDNQWSLRGPDETVSKNWTIQFAGAPGLAGNRAKKAFQLLQDENGNWREIHVTTPADRTVRVYVNPDKSPKQKLTESSAKRLLKAVREVHGGNCHLLRREGIVTINWQHVVRVDPQPDRSVKLRWNPPMVAHHNLNKDRVTAVFNNSSRTAVATEWI